LSAALVAAMHPLIPGGKMSLLPVVNALPLESTAGADGASEYATSFVASTGNQVAKIFSPGYLVA
jgi:hypothetical protein